jgi:hypothetical protein
MKRIVPDTLSPQALYVLMRNETLAWKQRALATLKPPLHLSISTLHRLCKTVRVSMDDAGVPQPAAVGARKSGQKKWLTKTLQPYNDAPNATAGLAALMAASNVSEARARNYLSQAKLYEIPLTHPLPRKKAKHA